MDLDDLTTRLKEREDLIELKNLLLETNAMKIGYKKTGSYWAKMFPCAIEVKIRKALDIIIDEELKNCEEQIKKLCQEQ